MKGGHTSGTWNSGSIWRHGETKTVRIPIALEKQIMDCARAIDMHRQPTDNISQRAGDIFLILEAIERYIAYKRNNYHPNQYSRQLDTSARAWDELRKLRKMLQESPQALGFGERAGKSPDNPTL